MAEDFGIISLANLDRGYEAIKRRSGDSSPMTSGDIATRVDEIPEPKVELTFSESFTENGSFNFEPPYGKVFRQLLLNIEVARIQPPRETDVLYIKLRDITEPLDPYKSLDVFYPEFIYETNEIYWKKATVANSRSEPFIFLQNYPVIITLPDTVKKLETRYVNADNFVYANPATFDGSQNTVVLFNRQYLWHSDPEAQVRSEISFTN